jgi:hypothetical protein
VIKQTILCKAIFLNGCHADFQHYFVEPSATVDQWMPLLRQQDEKKCCHNTSKPTSVAAEVIIRTLFCCGECTAMPLWIGEFSAGCAPDKTWDIYRRAGKGSMGSACIGS